MVDRRSFIAAAAAALAGSKLPIDPKPNVPAVLSLNARRYAEAVCVPNELIEYCGPSADEFLMEGFTKMLRENVDSLIMEKT
jgi:hypothetical protein